MHIKIYLLKYSKAFVEEAVLNCLPVVTVLQ